jgi:hypothetical protein
VRRDGAPLEYLAVFETRVHDAQSLPVVTLKVFLYVFLYVFLNVFLDILLNVGDAYCHTQCTKHWRERGRSDAVT